MKLSEGVEQAIHCTAFLAGLSEDGVLSAAALAELHGVSTSYLLNRLGAALGVRAFSLHPGVILTDLARHLSEDEINSFDVYDENGNRRVDPSRDLKTPEQGAATSVWAATRPELDGIGGVYCED